MFEKYRLPASAEQQQRRRRVGNRKRKAARIRRSILQRAVGAGKYVCAGGAFRGSETYRRTTAVRRWKSGGGGGLKDNENDFFSSRKEKGPGLPGTAAGVVVVRRTAAVVGGGCVTCIYAAAAVRCVRGGWRACKTVLYAGHNNSPRFGSRSKGGAVAGIMVGGGRLYTNVEGYEGTRGEREPTFGRVYSR